MKTLFAPKSATSAVLILNFWLISVVGHAATVINSPTSVEVPYAYETEFETGSSKTTEEEVREHAKFLFGYLQNHGQVEAFGLPDGVEGIGAPMWPPKLTVLAAVNSGNITKIRYRSQGRMLLYKKVAHRLLESGQWNITLPYDVDHFFIKECAPWDGNTVEDFWYSYDPFKKGCESLRQAPLAREVVLTLARLPLAPTLDSDLGALRGHGRGILISSVDGYDDEASATDPGALRFEAANSWLREQGFTEKILFAQSDWTIHQFDKVFTRKDGSHVPVRLARFLGETEIKEANSVMYGRFLIESIAKADVIIYDGHSGYGLNMDIAELEARAGKPVVFNNAKRQIFFFNSCSSYSYFLPVFMKNKASGTLDFLSNGIETITDFGVPVERVLYRYLFDVDNDHPTWDQIISDMEAPLGGRSFLLNVSRNTPALRIETTQSNLR